MKGSIVKCLEELVCTKFSKDIWHKSLEDVGLKKDTVFFTVSDIHDSTVMKVFEAVCNNLNISLTQATDAFGDYWVNDYSRKVYHQYYTRNKTAKEFLLDMDNVHVAMTKTINNARPPRFKYEWIDDKTLIIHYNSKRGLIDLAIGLTKGVGKFYNENLTVTKLSPEKFQVIFE